MGVHVRGETHLERDLPLEDVLEQRGVFPQSSTVADPLGAALMERLVDRIRAVPLTGVTGARHAVLRRVLERGRVVARRKAPLGARQVERHDARRPVARRRARQLQGLRGSSRADTAHDQPDLGARLRFPPFEPGQRRSASFVRRGGPWRALTTTRKMAPPSPTGSPASTGRPTPSVTWATPRPTRSARSRSSTSTASRTLAPGATLTGRSFTKTRISGHLPLHRSGGRPGPRSAGAAPRGTGSAHPGR